MAENTEKIFNINYQIEQLEKQKQEIKKRQIEELIEKESKLIFEENKKESFSEWELKTILKGFAYDIEQLSKN